MLQANVQEYLPVVSIINKIKQNDMVERYWGIS